MAASYQGLLRTKTIIPSSLCTYNRTILKIFGCNKLWTRNIASNSKEDSKESNSSDLKALEHQKADVEDPPKKKSVWTEPIPEEFRTDHLPNPARNTEREYFQRASDPNSQLFFESKYYSRKHGISREVYSWLNWDININDDEEVTAAIKKYEYKMFKIDQRFLEERNKAVGPELGAAHFIIARGGAVKFLGRDHWYVKDAQNNISVPRYFVDNLFIEAIDASKMNLTYVGFDNLEKLSHLRFLKFNNCPYIDDWCLARLLRLKHSLEFLDISNCPGITDNGLAVLSYLQNLKGLRVSNLENVKHLGLLTLLLEEKIPELSVLGVKDEELKPPLWEHRGERRLVRALLGYVDEEKEGDNIGKVGELPSSESEDYNNVFKRIIRRVE